MKKIIALLLFAISSATFAAEQLTIVVPFAAGGPVDTVARVLQNYLPGETGKTVVVINKPGAGGMIATDYIIENKNKSLLILHSPAIFINQLMGNAKYNVFNDLYTVGYFGYHPFILVSSNKFQHKDLRNWNDLPKNTTISLANGGVGTTAYISNKLFEKNFKNINFIDVSYGAGAGGLLMPDLLSGNVDATMSYGAVFEGFSEERKLYPMAVANPTRLSYLPNVPTLKELGVTETYVNNHYFLYMSSGIDKADADKIREATHRLLKNPQFVESLRKSGVEIRNNVNDNYDRMLESQYNFFKKTLEEIK